MVRVEIDAPKLKKAMHGKRDKVAAHLDLHPNSISRKLSGRQGISLEDVAD